MKNFILFLLLFQSNLLVCAALTHAPRPNPTAQVNPMADPLFKQFIEYEKFIFFKPNPTADELRKKYAEWVAFRKLYEKIQTRQDQGFEIEEFCQKEQDLLTGKTYITFCIFFNYMHR